MTISIVVPLDVLPKGMTLDSETLISALTNYESATLKAERTQAEYNSLVSQVKSIGANLELILNEVDDPFEKVRALRNLVTELKEWGSSVRPMP